MEIKNNTPFEFIAIPNYDKEGNEIFTNIVKGTFSLITNQSLKIAEKQVPIVFADEYLGEPAQSPIKYESDLALYKPFTDVIMLGFAHHHQGYRIDKIDVYFSVGELGKRVTIRSDQTVDRIPLNLLEHFGKEKGMFKGKNIGTGFGFYPKQYPPRVNYAGTYDEKWQKIRSPFLPEDFDYCFFQSAYPELISKYYLKGTEIVSASNVSIYGPIKVALPGISINVETIFEKKSVKEKTFLDTIILEPEEKRILLIWRQMIPCNGLVQDIRGFEINMSTVK